MNIATYLFGYAAGSLVTGPFSETVGRSPVYVISMILFTLSSMATALSPNLGAQLTFRFFAGFFGSTLLVCAGGSLTDLWSPKENIYLFPVFSHSLIRWQRRRATYRRLPCSIRPQLQMGWLGDYHSRRSASPGCHIPPTGNLQADALELEDSACAQSNREWKI